MVQKKEKLSFSLTLMGQTLIFNTVNLYLLIFYTDVLGIAAGVAGTLFLFARIWDAVNDPVMGVLVDKTSSPWGKCRPYLLFTPLPIALITVGLFAPVSLEESGKIIFVTVTYILWGMVYTSLDIPLWTLSSRMARDSRERQSIIGWGRAFNIIGSALPVALFVPLKNFLSNGSEARGYFGAVIIFSVAALLFMIQGFWGTRERVSTTVSQRPGLGASLRAIVANRPLLLLLTSNMLVLFVSLPVTAGIYYATYNLQDESLFPVLAGTVLISAIIGSVLAPVLSRRISPRNIIIASSLMAAAFFSTGFFLPEDNLILTLLFIFIIGFLLGLPLVLRTSMLADTVEYAEMKTGKQNEGIIFSTMTFTGKLKLGASAFLVGFILDKAGYLPPELVEKTQTVQTLTAIRAMLTLIPGLGCILTVIPLFFYTYSQKDRLHILESLKKESG